MSENEIASIIVDKAFQIHKEIGPGILESAFEECLSYELKQSNLKVERQKQLPLQYKGVQLDCGYRLDLLVSEKVIVEVKTVDEIHPIHTAQLLTYLKLTNTKLGLIINFNSVLIKNGVKRIVNGL